jgi:hypothetical protein
MQQLAGLINENYVDLRPINSPFMENDEDDDDSDNVESSEEEYDFTSPGKRDEFDLEDDVEPTSKDVKAGDALAKTAGGKQGKLNMLIKQKDAILTKFKSGQITIDQYKAEIGDIPMQIKQLQADIDSDLTIDDEDEY